jgi:hypothetical protein
MRKKHSLRALNIKTTIISYYKYGLLVGEININSENASNSKKKKRIPEIIYFSGT